MFYIILVITCCHIILSKSRAAAFLAPFVDFRDRTNLGDVDELGAADVGLAIRKSG